MNYRMITISAGANDDVVKMIQTNLEKKGELFLNFSLKFIGFEAPAGTQLILNNNDEGITVPSNGKFITPFNGDYYMHIRNLVFPNGFSGNIYYII